MDFQLWHFVLLGSALILAALFILVLAEPGLPYRVNVRLPPVGEHTLLGLLAALVDTPVSDATSIQVLTNGSHFYPRMLDDITRAHRSIHLEAYVFHVSAIADRLLASLCERARAGVQVRLVIDSIGSVLTPDSYFADLRKAGGQVSWYQPIRWYTLKRFNNRTHRELLVIDGEVAFAGGAGVAAWWDKGAPELPPWRDMMVRLEGPVQLTAPVSNRACTCASVRPNSANMARLCSPRCGARRFGSAGCWSNRAAARGARTRPSAG